MAEEAGRNPKSMDLVLCVTAFGEKVPSEVGDGEWRLFSDMSAEVAAAMLALRDMGVGHLGFGGVAVDAMLGEMEKFRKEVLVLV